MLLLSAQAMERKEMMKLRDVLRESRLYNTLMETSPGPSGGDRRLSVIHLGLGGDQPIMIISLPYTLVSTSSAATPPSWGQTAAPLAPANPR
jgi:hypothetical protein